MKNRSQALRAYGRAAIAVASVLAAAILLNLLFSLLPETVKKPDLTGKDTFHISSTTRKELERLDADVTVWLLASGGKAAAEGDLYMFLSRYAEASDRLSLKVVDPAGDAEFLSSRGLDADGVENTSILVESAARQKLIDASELYYYRYYDASAGELILTVEEYAALVYNLSKTEDGAATLTQLMAGLQAYFDAESRVTNAIRYVTTQQTARLYVLTGNGCSAIESQLESQLDKSSYDVQPLAALTSLPADCDALLIHAPTVDLSEDEHAALDAYLQRDGKLFLVTGNDMEADKTNAEALPRFAALLGGFGMRFAEEKHILCEGSAGYCYGTSSKSYPNLFYARIDSTNPATGLFDGQFLIGNGHAILAEDAEGVKNAPWLYTSQAGYLADANGEPIGEKAAYACGVTAERGEARVVWLASAEALSLTMNSYSGTGGNYTLVQEALDYLCGIDSETVPIQARMIDTSTLAVTDAGFAVCGILLVLVLPGAAVGIGIWIGYVRKKRR